MLVHLGEFGQGVVGSEVSSSEYLSGLSSAVQPLRVVKNYLVMAIGNARRIYRGKLRRRHAPRTVWQVLHAWFMATPPSEPGLPYF